MTYMEGNPAECVHIEKDNIIEYNMHIEEAVTIISK